MTPQEERDLVVFMKDQFGKALIAIHARGIVMDVSPTDLAATLEVVASALANFVATARKEFIEKGLFEPDLEPEHDDDIIKRNNNQT